MSKDYYSILTVNALELTRHANQQRILGRSGFKKKPSYLVDLTDPLVCGSSMMVSRDLQNTNALFDQILLDSDDAFKALQYKLSGPDILLKSIIFVDFTEMFESLGGIDGAEKVIQDIQDHPEPFTTADHLKRLLTPYYEDSCKESDLLRIRFKDGDEHTFLPFDKSSSMSKHCRISFINSRIRDRLDKRLQLDFPFSKLKVQLSKYYAYRGLYLTTGRRINSDPDHGFVLDQNTVIVIPDLEIEPRHNFVSDGGANGSLPLLIVSEGEPKPGECHRFSTKREKAKPVNAFDGEGLIHADYMRYIDSLMRGLNETDDQKKNGRNADDRHRITSVQIRMPYAKGMLHEVNYDGFLEDEGPDAAVIDYFGIPRRIKNAKMILTASMFKCGKWLKEYQKEHPEEDPMKRYFEQFHGFDHALYVCGSNGSLRPDGYEYLNYQYLDTLALNSQEFDRLIENHFENSWGQLHQTYRDKNHPAGKIIEAAKINESFYTDELLIDQAVSSCRKARAELTQGHLLSRGEHCFLSADLLVFLYYLKDLVIDAADPGHGHSRGTDLYDRYPDVFLNERFYRPAGTLPLSADTYYPVLRSPHLSRNEELILRPYLPADREDPYRKYFGHLSGVLMLPAASFSAMILGSADYDGDLCKIYDDPVIAEAIHRGAYTKKYQRKIPVAIIPDEKGHIAVPNNNEFVKLIINTFSNCTGLISNIAVRFAETEYNENQKNSAGDPGPGSGTEDHFCEITGLIVALEIDSCKHGRHPCEDIKYLNRKVYGRGGKSRRFIEMKNLMKRFQYPFAIRENKNGYELTFIKNRLSKLVQPYGDCHNLLRLPYEFARRSYQVSNEDDWNELVKRGILAVPSDEDDEIARFDFVPSRKHSLPEGLTDLGMEEAGKLIEAYRQFQNDYAAYQKKQKALKDIDEIALLYTLLGAKYDSINGRLPYSDGMPSVQTVSETLGDFLTVLRELPDSVLAAAENKQDSWIFTKKEDRLSKLKELCFRGGSEPTPEMEALVCDFSFDGYLILGLALKTAQKQKKALSAFDKFQKKKRSGNAYYQGLWEQFFVPKPEEAAEASDLSDDEDDSSGGGEPAFDPQLCTANLIHETCFEMLKEIAVNYSAECPEDPEYEALKYAWAATYGEENDASFFWDVLPKKLILSHVLEGKFNA